MDRERVIRAVDSCFDYWLDQHRYIHPLELEHVRQLKADAIAMLKEQPEIVRCKDCKHSKQSRFSNRFCCELSFSYNEPDWFCADGEREEE